MNYTPQPGTVPYRALAYLKALPEGVQPPSTVELAEALGVDPAVVTATLPAALRDGQVQRHPFTTAAGRASYRWTAVAGQPAPAAEVDDDPPRRKLVPTYVALQPLRFNAALWLDGSLILSGIPVRKDGVVVLDPEQTARLRQLVGA